MYKLYFCGFFLFFLLSCKRSDLDVNANSFFSNYQNYAMSPVDDSKLISSYFGFSGILDDDYLNGLSGTEINILCSFMDNYKKSNFKLNDTQKKLLDEDFKKIKAFLSNKKHAGNIYRACIEPFLLPVEKNLRYKKE